MGLRAEGGVMEIENVIILALAMIVSVAVICETVKYEHDLKLNCVYEVVK